MKRPEHILVVDDDPTVRALLERYLSKHGFRVTMAASGAAMERALAAESIDLVVLDLMLPDQSGFHLTRRLRETSDLPVIMLTGLGEDADRIVGLEIGADDYLSKPFNPRELLARVRTVLRRTRKDLRRSVVLAPFVRFAGWVLDLNKGILSSPNGEDVRLTAGEYDLLAVFVANPQRVLNRDLLLDLTRQRQREPFDRSIDVQVSRLRRKIESDPKAPEIIQTVRGRGYMFTPSVERV